MTTDTTTCHICRIPRCEVGGQFCSAPHPTVEELLRMMAEGTKPVGARYDAAEVMRLAAIEIERLHRALEGRDMFLVSKDLFSEFAGQVEVTPP